MPLFLTHPQGVLISELNVVVLPLRESPCIGFWTMKSKGNIKEASFKS